MVLGVEESVLNAYHISVPMNHLYIQAWISIYRKCICSVLQGQTDNYFENAIFKKRSVEMFFIGLLAGGTVGALTMCIFASRSYEKGYKDAKRGF